MNSTFEKLMFLSKRKKIGTLCCAPFTSMYFGHRGIISACCSNRTKILGTYPEKNLLEIWNSKERDQLQKDLQSFKFSLGCDQCKKLFTAGNFTSLKIPHHDIPGNNYKNLKYPFKLNFELDNKCNLMCIMCSGKFSSKILKYREKKPDYISPYLTDNFFNELKPFLDNAGHLDFYGGEPFLIDIYFKILDYVQKHNPNIQIYIQTNGTIASKKVLDYIKDLQINLSISMDSVIEETYEKIRIGANYKSVVKNIDSFYNIIKNTNRQLYMSPILSNLNYTELADFYYFSSKYDIKLYFHDLTTPKDLSVYSIPEDTLQININLIEEKINNIRPVTETEIFNYNVLLSQISHLKYVYNKTKKNKNTDMHFSMTAFLSSTFPDYYKIYSSKLVDYGITDEIFSKSIVFESMQERPENYIYKRFSKSSYKEVEVKLDNFIKSLVKNELTSTGGANI